MAERLRGYFVVGDEDHGGIAVVARTAREAKLMALGYSPLDMSDYVQLRVRWQRDADVDGLSRGVVEDSLDALRRGFYGWIENCDCPVCGEGGRRVYCDQGRFYCDACEAI